MHERALMDDVMTKILSVATTENAKRVTHVSVRLGALSHFTPEHFREHFDDAARGTIAAGADVTATVDTEVTAAAARDVVLESVEIEERA